LGDAAGDALNAGRCANQGVSSTRNNTIMINMTYLEGFRANL
jgi:hypothetical protein